jgi:hypothetical protein
MGLLFVENRDMENAEGLNEAATEALANAMYRYTFGIVGDDGTGAGDQSLGTGVGVFWKETYLILTAAHTMEAFPYEQLYFFLPHEAIHFQGSSVAAQPSPIRVRRRFQPENPQAILADNGEDLAAFVLEEQKQEQGQRHFYRLDDFHVTPPVAEQVGILGYPGATRLSVGQNFMATPYPSFGEMVGVPAGSDPNSRIAIRYPTSHSVDAHGLSGCGLWVAQKDSADELWTPTISLIGLVTDWFAPDQLLVGYRVEELVAFLSTKRQWMKGD